MDVSFKARARTLDMLGRQQIAGIPTAVSELFKNAHDAYADRVEVDYFRDTGLFVLRDNGLGMTKKEFIDRWLTIATESSVERQRSRHRNSQSARRSRPILGKKGIGRLAIASIAPQVLVLTRALREGELSDLTASFVSWRVFETHGINLEDIRIPLQSFPGGTLPSSEDIVRMVEAFCLQNAHLQAQMGNGKWERISEDLRQFKVNPSILANVLNEPTLLGDGHGTHFFLLPVSPDLAHDISGDPGSDLAPPLHRALLGFTTPSFALSQEPVMKTAFRDHQADGSCEDLISSEKFFTRSEYEHADHRISGEFDDFGQFKGDVSVYGETEHDHVINWSGGKGHPTACGPFRIKFAAMEGASRFSTLPTYEHARLLSKTRRIGGLYIYRDGVRIQPYGNVDYDWLEIELRRSKSASYYYFSYRQMFGIVEIDSVRNSKLSEKAGREGFRENKAYRELRSILKSFLTQIAADFFRRGGSYSERFTDYKAELAEALKHRELRAKKAAVKRKRFARDLETLFQRFENEKPIEWVFKFGQEVQQRLREAGRNSDPKEAAKQIVTIESNARKALRDLESSYRVAKPRVGISRSLQLDWNHYKNTVEDLLQNIDSVRNSIEKLVADEVAKAHLDLSARARLETALKEVVTLAINEARDEQQQILTEAERVSADAQEITTKCIRDVESTIRGVMTEFSRRDFAGLDDQRWKDERSTLEAPIRLAMERAVKKLESALSQLKAIDVLGDSSIVDQLAAVEQSNVTLREQAVADMQLAQLGMAIEVISHEFGAAIRSIRSGLRTLKAWADVNPDLVSLYQSIRGSFDHLDGYLSLFTPLQRRLYRKAVNIRGWEIFEFLQNLFERRLGRHQIEFARTEAFAKVKLHGYPSSFYPVFVNLLDNAIYWLSGQNDRLVRRVRLDAFGQILFVSDTGPGIHARDRDAVFEAGFTRKPGGRGMGLHIARETLREAGYDLNLEDTDGEWSTTFLIKPLNNS